LQQIKKSIPEARNQGVGAAKSDIIVFTDDDCVFNKDWIKNLIQPFLNDTGVGIVGGGNSDGSIF
jgi:cellulose synthase/poly-beta-1,6-N-acetylglucosamine synthase-like glycosyltransferase